MLARRFAAAVVVASVLSTFAALPGSAGDRPAGGWYRIEMASPIRQPAVDAVTAAGAHGLRYWPHDSYLAWIAASDLAAVSGAHGVSRVVPLTAAQKIHPELDQAGVRDALLVHVYTPSVENVTAALTQRWTVTATTPGADQVTAVLVAAPLVDARAIAQLPDVVWVGPASGGLEALDEMSDQIQAGNITGTATAPGYEAWLAAQGLDGSGVRVSIVDTGIDNHPDLAPRIKGRVSYSQAPTGEPIDVGGHGTHVAGIVGGDGTGAPGVGRVRDGAGYLYGLGVAPKVELVDQNAIATTTPKGVNCSGGWSPTGGWPVLTRDALAKGAHIWNASWRTCEGAGIGYVDSSRNLDMMVRDGDNTAAGNQPFTMVFAAGNAGAASGTASQKSIEAPSEAKNTIVVAASANTRSGGNFNSIAGFSSRGPAADGRLLPTITAPGQYIMSTRPFGGVSCNTPTQDSYGLYSSCSGTSMAAPHVTGAVALITQWWRKGAGDPAARPSPAMAKALLINSARDMAAADIPNRNEGWGRVDLGALFSTALPRITADQVAPLTDPGESVTYRIAVADPAKPLKATLVWTDAPASAGAKPALVNDLDLALTSDAGTQYVGNTFAQGFSAVGGAPDRVNNIENVFVKQPGGTYTLTVSAASLPGDGIPGQGDATDQDFALVVTNGTVVP